MDEIKKSVEKVGSTVSETIEKVGETPFVKESKEKVKAFIFLLKALFIKNLTRFIISVIRFLNFQIKYPPQLNQ